MALKSLTAAACSLIIAHSASALAQSGLATRFPFCSLWTETAAATVNVAFPEATCSPPPATTGALPANLRFLVPRAYLPNGGFDKVPLPTALLQFASLPPVTLPQYSSIPAAAAEPTRYSSIIVYGQRAAPLAQTKGA